MLLVVTEIALRALSILFICAFDLLLVLLLLQMNRRWQWWQFSRIKMHQYSKVNHQDTNITDHYQDKTWMTAFLKSRKRSQWPACDRRCQHVSCRQYLSDRQAYWPHQWPDEPLLGSSIFPISRDPGLMHCAAAASGTSIADTHKYYTRWHKNIVIMILPASLPNAIVF